MAGLCRAPQNPPLRLPAAALLSNTDRARVPSPSVRSPATYEARAGAGRARAERGWPRNVHAIVARGRKEDRRAFQGPPITIITPSRRHTCDDIVVSPDTPRSSQFVRPPTRIATPIHGVFVTRTVSGGLKWQNGTVGRRIQEGAAQRRDEYSNSENRKQGTAWGAGHGRPASGGFLTGVLDRRRTHSA
jgi:hypothetical protein